MNLKTKITNVLNYLLMFSLLAIASTYANAVDVTDELNQYLKPPLSKIVEEYYNHDYPVSLFAFNGNMLYTLNEHKIWEKSVIAPQGAVITSIAVNHKGIMVAAVLFPRDKQTYSDLKIMAFDNNSKKWEIVKSLSPLLGKITVTPGGKFILVPGTNSLFISEDGFTWKEIEKKSLDLASISAAAMDRDGTIVVTGQQNEHDERVRNISIISNKFKNTQKVQVPNTIDLKGVAVNPKGIFVIVGTTSDNKCFLQTSNDGIHWETPNLPQICTSNDTSIGMHLQHVKVNDFNGMFMVLGRTNSAKPIIMTSIDGKTWEDRSSASPQQVGTVLSSLGHVVAKGNEMFVLYDTTSDDLIDVVNYTTNGKTWGEIFRR